MLTAAFSRREQPVVHRDVCLGRQQRRACLPEHPHRYVVSLHLTKLYNRSSPRHSTVDTHAPQSMWQYPPKAIHRHLPLCQPHVPFLDKPRNMLTRVQKSTASSPARPSTRARAARTSSAASARPCRSSRRPTQSRRRDAARRTHGVTMYCTCTLAAACDCDCGASTTRYACHVRCNAMQLCKYVHESCRVSRRPGCLILVDLPSFNVGFLFVCASPSFPIAAGARLC